MTLVSWMIYALAVSVLLSLAARLLEQGLSAVRASTRWVWLAALLLSVGLPAVATLRAPTPEPAGPAVERPLIRETAAPIEQQETVGGWAALVARLSSAYRAGSRAFDRGVAAAATAVSVGASQAWVLGLWLAASALLAVVMLSSLVRLAGRARAWPRATMLGRVVRVAPDFGPATVGLLRPQVVVPRWAGQLPDDDLEVVLAHEEEHARARDPLLQAVGLLALVACPWNPLVWWQLRRLGQAVEVDCDRRVLARGVSAPRYGDLLVKLGGRAPRGVLPATTMSGTPSCSSSSSRRAPRRRRLRTDRTRAPRPMTSPGRTCSSSGSSGTAPFSWTTSRTRWRTSPRCCARSSKPPAAS